MRRVVTFLIAAVLVVGMVGCDGASRYSLTMAVAPIGSGTATDLTNALSYAAGREVSIAAVAAAGYWFASWTAPAGTFANADSPETTFIVPAQDVTVTANFEPAEFHGGTGTAEDPYQIADWHQLDYVRNYLDSHFVLVGNLGRTTSGYEELAGATANQGAGWQPIGAEHDPFAGSFDGQEYEIRELFMNRPEETLIGLFGLVDEKGAVENIGVMNANVNSGALVGGLVGDNLGNVTNCYAIGNVTAYDIVGGLVGINGGNVSYCYFTGGVTGTGSTGELSGVGGLVGINAGNVSYCYSTGDVTGETLIGGLIGFSWLGTISDSYSTSGVSGQDWVGGLVGGNGWCTVSNSYATGSVTGTSDVGGLVGTNGGEGTVRDSYSTGSVPGDASVGGLVGLNVGNVTTSFWDTETSGQSASDGGTGKTTAEMRDIITFSGASWDIVGVANPDIRNLGYIWNIVDGSTYPFLSWEP